MRRRRSYASEVKDVEDVGDVQRPGRIHSTNESIRASNVLDVPDVPGIRGGPDPTATPVSQNAERHHQLGLENPTREIAQILARGYLRLLMAGHQSPGIGTISAPRKSPSGSSNCLDVAGRAKHELETEGRP
jgi:hypothetical protein